MSSIIAPFGEPIEARPAVPTEEERIAEREARKRVKDERRGKRAARGVGADGTPMIKTEDEVLEGVQESREREGAVKDVE